MKTAAAQMTGGACLTKEDVKRLIKENGIEMIRFEFSDLNGINRGKLLPVTMIDEVLEHGIAFCAVILAIGFDNHISDVGGLSEYNYDDMVVKADPSTFLILTHLEKTALLLGDIYYHGKPMRQSPRLFLKNMIKKYNALGLNPITASELEFYLYKRVGDKYDQYTNKAYNCYTSNMRIDPSGFLYQLTKTLKDMNFDILYMNHEYYPGQYEYNWSHGPALDNCDQTFNFKGILKDIAEQNDLLATFMAKPANNVGGSGCHFHISLGDLKTGENKFADPSDPVGIADLMKYFVAGVLKHARALTALLAPTINCYKRYIPDSFAPCFIGWGYDNRTTFVRIPAERGKATRVEVRSASAAANPYLAVAGILAAGLDGITNKLEPPALITTDLYHDTSVQTNFIPRSLYRSLEELKNDEWLKEMAGEDLINNFVALKSYEVECYTNYVTEWEWETYSYHI
jgi:glutamine synthetase